VEMNEDGRRVRLRWLELPIRSRVLRLTHCIVYRMWRGLCSRRG
jgi:hypothetical protein